jgi:hypothetical protein
MKLALIISGISILVACSEKNRDQNPEIIHTIDTTVVFSQKETDELNISDFRGVYEFVDRHHGSGSKLFVENGYALYIRQGVWGEINDCKVGVLKAHNDTFEFHINFTFVRPAYMLGDKAERSSDWIDFNVYHDTTTALSAKIFRFFPTISDSDTVMNQYIGPGDNWPLPMKKTK